MNKSIKRIIAVGLSVMSLTVTAIMPTKTASAAEVRGTSVNEVVQDLNSEVKTVRYSDMLKGDGAINFKVILPEGVKLTTSSANTFSNAVTQNYDISISEGVHYSKSYFRINVNWSNPGIKFVGDWVINVDGTAFTDGKARALKINVNNDLGVVGAPKILTNVDKGVTVKQLTQGFDLEMNIQNAKFNTACFGNYIRVSMINSSGLRIHPVAYCNVLRPDKVKMRVQATNGVENWRTHFEFKIEGNATNSSVPITVRIPIIR